MITARLRVEARNCQGYTQVNASNICGCNIQCYVQVKGGNRGASTIPFISLMASMERFRTLNLNIPQIRSRLFHRQNSDTKSVVAHEIERA